MQRKTILAIILIAVMAVTYFITSTASDYDATLFWHDVAAGVFGWAGLMLFTYYILDYKTKKKRGKQ